jgi:hypothetical protein
MTKGIKNEMLLMVLFFCLTNAISGKAQTKTQTKTDTILCNNKNLIIKYPRISKINIDNYEEGYFKTINCVLDTAIITIHCGSMVNLPLTDLTKKIICSEFVLDKELRSIRGYQMINKRKNISEKIIILDMVLPLSMIMSKKQDCHVMSNSSTT